MLCVLTMMMRTGDYVPDMSWVVPARGRGMNLASAETLWAMWTSTTPTHYEPLAIAEVFFDRSAPNETDWWNGEPPTHEVRGVPVMFRSDHDLLTTPLEELRKAAAEGGNAILNARQEADGVAEAINRTQRAPTAAEQELQRFRDGGGSEMTGYDDGNHINGMREDMAANPDTYGYEQDGFVVADGMDDENDDGLASDTARTRKRRREP